MLRKRGDANAEKRPAPTPGSAAKPFKKRRPSHVGAEKGSDESPLSRPRRRLFGSDDEAEEPRRREAPRRSLRKARGGEMPTPRLRAEVSWSDEEVELPHRTPRKDCSDYGGSPEASEDESEREGPAGAAAEASPGTGEGREESSEGREEPELDFTKAAGKKTWRRVYFLTLSQCKLGTREQVGTVVDLCFALAYPHMTLEYYSVFKEPHADGNTHFHVCIKGSRTFRWAALKRKLQEKLGSGASVHISDAACGYHACFRYCSLPSSKKTMAQLDSAPLLSDRHPPKHEALTAPKWVSNFKKPECDKEEEEEATKPKQRKPPKTVLVNMAVRYLGLANMDIEEAAAVLTSYAQDESDAGRHDLFGFVTSTNNLRGVILRQIEISTAKLRLIRMRKTRIEILREAAELKCASKCDGRCRIATEQILDLQGFKDRFIDAVLHALQVGRMKEANIFIHGDKNRGKSFLLQPLTKIFNCFLNPTKGTFSLMKLPGKECVVLEDFRYHGGPADILCQEQFLQWLEGQQVEIKMPKNEAGAEDVTYSGDAPLFFSSKGPLYVTFGGGGVDVAETEMLQVRLDSFHCTQPIPRPDYRLGKIKCAACYARMLLRL